MVSRNVATGYQTNRCNFTLFQLYHRLEMYMLQLAECLPTVNKVLVLSPALDNKLYIVVHISIR